MSTQEIYSHVESLPLSDKIVLLENILSLIKRDVKMTDQQKMSDAHKKELYRRRKEFKVETFDFGCDVDVDRDELYANRGL